MAPTLSLAPAAPADIPALERLVNHAYRGDASRQGWTTEADLLDGTRVDAAELHRMLAAPGATLLVGRNEQGEPVACAYLHVQPPQLYLGMLSVQPTLQAQGVGRLLLQAAEQHARQYGCHRIKITVISDRTELLAWYERHGYQRTGATEAFPTDPRFGVPRKPLALLVLTKSLG
ncbi:GNAT family N-acetyltransferase [Hymenobacter aerilatus]|uniref:GNAT family N-acetyltransferase n=1 Tax=Hymenobacter aerilatus TaxID=2932251 RepID=A0A8T9SZK0_9BACT|nr:GNAT family N-acetyltransferase [Hymenobacter aerilatus]UOR07528.1 GNAT family N-acetyltransferase [Hymenobacter aerilatus]